jgi:hypothetical protein
LAVEPGGQPGERDEKGDRGVENRIRSGLSVAAVVAATIVAPVVGAPAAQAGIVGGISVEQFCQGWYGSSWHAVVRINNINGWRCTSGGIDNTVNYTTACAQQRATPYWGYSDYNNPYTIYCYT